MPSETQTNHGLVGTFVDDVINDHRADRATELLAQTVVDHNKIVLTEPEEPGAAEEGLRMLFTAFPDLHADACKEWTTANA
jgi:predicted SnoaL-like aldol condensation-catalyzing enzyme